ncbi:MAG TPA: hypothetical protein PLM07_19135 [Candidatus Rifleibacterium sp.]|nr:hypothetical protein [Candidatus Rifleibacterium sp.]HPT48001.1 hypothetical protein [Candidatus Rifleibacterium sp.]
MREKNRVFVEVEAVDQQLLHSSVVNGTYAVRVRNEHRIALISLTGGMINLVSEPLTWGPDFILCRKLPPPGSPITEDGWIFEDSCLTIPFMTRLNLDGVTRFDSDARIGVRDFPGHLRSMITRRLRQPDCEYLKELEIPLATLSKSIREHLIESAEIPVIGVTGLGSGEVAAGDAALCGMLLTTRCFSLGGRFKMSWFQRLAVEVRRFMHRASVFGRNWIGYAIDGRMTETQQIFFNAMARDFEGAGEVLVKRIADDDIINGRAFLSGVNMTLEMIQAGVFNRG